MAENSVSCKTWCITLVSAILVVIADKGKPNLALLAILPTVLFFLLDSYYLALERLLRASYKQFLGKLHAKRIMPEDLFVIAPKGEVFRTMLESMLSFSIFPFYTVLLFTIIIVRWVVI